MAYEPAINTTQGASESASEGPVEESPVEKVKHSLSQALEIASANHMAVIGFIVSPDGTAEPFASSRLSMRPEEFRKFVEILAAAMADPEN